MQERQQGQRASAGAAEPQQKGGGGQRANDQASNGKQKPAQQKQCALLAAAGNPLAAEGHYDVVRPAANDAQSQRNPLHISSPHVFTKCLANYSTLHKKNKRNYAQWFIHRRAKSCEYFMYMPQNGKKNDKAGRMLALHGVFLGVAKWVDAQCAPLQIKFSITL